MKIRMVAITLFSLSASIGAQAQSCADNFSQEGVPLMTGISYKSHQTFPNVAPSVAVDRLARAVLAEGFVGMRVEKSYGAITAYQETSGSGRAQQLRVVARPAGKGSRVDIVFSIQQGQLAAEGPVRSSLCRIMAGARG